MFQRGDARRECPISATYRYALWDCCRGYRAAWPPCTWAVYCIDVFMWYVSCERPSRKAMWHISSDSEQDLIDRQWQVEIGWPKCVEKRICAAKYCHSVVHSRLLSGCSVRTSLKDERVDLLPWTAALLNAQHRRVWVYCRQIAFWRATVRQRTKSTLTFNLFFIWALHSLFTNLRNMSSSRTCLLLIVFFLMAKIDCHLPQNCLFFQLFDISYKRNTAWTSLLARGVSKTDIQALYRVGQNKRYHTVCLTLTRANLNLFL